MHRNEYLESLSPRQQHAILRREFLRSYSSEAHRRQQPEHNLDMLFNGRRYSLDMQSDFPVNPKFMLPIQASRNANEHEIVSDWPDGEFNLDEIAVAATRRNNSNLKSGTSSRNGNDNCSTAQQVLNTDQVVRNLTAVGRILEILQRWPLPRLSFTTACICFLLAIFISPRSCAENILFPVFRLSFGTLYPAYASYKAVRTKNVKEYVKWMMYWIVYAFFTCIETFTDIFLSWFPFYYEVKVIIVLWLLSPATKGSSTLYRKFVHPMLTRREQEIDEYLNQAKERGYSAVLQLGSKGVNYATNVIMQTALKGGGNLVQTLRRSYSLSDLSEPDVHRTQDEVDEVSTIRPQQRILRPRLQTAVGRSASGTRHSTGMYFTEVDVTGKGAGDFNYNIRSSDDISSGYSSAEPVYVALSRTSSMTNASKSRLKAKRSEIFEANIQKEYFDEPYAAGVLIPETFQKEWGDETIVAYKSYLKQKNPQTKVEHIFSVPKHKAEVEDATVPNISEMFVPDKVQKKWEEEVVVDYQTCLPKKIPQTRTQQTECEKILTEVPMLTISEQKETPEKSQKTQEDLKQNQELEWERNNDSNDESTDDDFLDTLSTTSIETNATATAEQDLSETHSQISPKDLIQTLQKIKDSFRATIEAAPTHAKIQQNAIIKQIEEAKRTPHIHHKKGKAPAPPTQLCTTNPEAVLSLDAASISSLSSSRSSSPASSRSGFFKNMRHNIFRYNINNSSNNSNTIYPISSSNVSLGKETEI